MDKNTANGLIVVEGKTITAEDFKKIYILNNRYEQPDINWDGKSARNKRRLAERNAKKKRK